MATNIIRTSHLLLLFLLLIFCHFSSGEVVHGHEIGTGTSTLTTHQVKVRKLLEHVHEDLELDYIYHGPDHNHKNDQKGPGDGARVP